MEPQISVIIPAYNRAHTLARAIHSVLIQKQVDLELIIVDDGSTDQTEGMCQKVPCDSLKYLKQNNQGPAAARNLGIQNSKGEFIAFLDSDDEWLSEKLKAQFDFLIHNPNILIVQTEEIWIRNGKRVNPMKKHKKSGGYIFDKCLPLCIVSPSAVMMRKAFFEKVGLFDATFPACEDYELWLRASAQMEFGYIEKPFVVKYGGHADQTSRTYEKMDEFRVRALSKILNSGLLNQTQTEKATSELVKKCQILLRGSEKRGHLKEAAYFQDLISEMVNK